MQRKARVAGHVLEVPPICLVLMGEGNHRYAKKNPGGSSFFELRFLILKASLAGRGKTWVARYLFELPLFAWY